MGGGVPLVIAVEHDQYRENRYFTYCNMQVYVESEVKIKYMLKVH